MSSQVGSLGSETDTAHPFTTSSTPKAEPSRLQAWRGAHSARAGLYPDAVTDTEQRRRIGAARKLATVRRVRIAALERGSDGILVMLTIPLPGDLHEREAHSQARREVVSLAAGWPAWYKLEKGVSGALHAHVITVTEAVPHINHQDVNGVPIWNLRGLLAYLSKPGNAKAARSAHRRGVPVLDVWSAAEEYLAARATAAAEGRSRLPALSGVVNLPPRRKAALSPVLLLACLPAVLLSRAVMLARACTSRRPVFPAGVSVRLRRCWRVPGLPVRFRSRRPLLIGHARPPPRKRPHRW